MQRKFLFACPILRMPRCTSKIGTKVLLYLKNITTSTKAKVPVFLSSNSKNENMTTPDISIEED